MSAVNDNETEFLRSVLGATGPAIRAMYDLTSPARIHLLMGLLAQEVAYLPPEERQEEREYILATLPVAFEKTQEGHDRDEAKKMKEAVSHD